MSGRCLRVLMLAAVIAVLVVWYLLDSTIIVYHETSINILEFRDTFQGSGPPYEEFYTTSTEESPEPQISASAVNRTSSQARLMVYNRVPKCGSTTLTTIIRRLARMKNYTHHTSGIYGQRKLSEDQERFFIENQLKELQEHPEVPLSVDRHVYYINFTKYDVARPIYINVLRDPVSAFVSMFYYIRSKKRWKKLLNGNLHQADKEMMLKYQREIYPRNDTDPESSQLVLPNEEWLNKTLEECVQSGNFECNFEPGTERETFVAFLCGSPSHCSVMQSAAALQQAKSNLETEYSVVGLVEYMNVSLVVMEAYVPLFLRGLPDLFRKLGRSQHKNRTPHPEPSPEIRATLADTFSNDIELYEFAKQRLFLQLAAIEVQSTTTVDAEPFV